MKEVDELLEDHLQWAFRIANRIRGFVLLFAYLTHFSSMQNGDWFSSRQHSKEKRIYKHEKYYRSPDEAIKCIHFYNLSGVRWMVY
jgi:hypothetical protein